MKKSLKQENKGGGCMDNKLMSLRESDLKDLQIQICKDLVCQELDGEMVILDMHAGLYFGIDAVGTRIWQMLQEGVPPATMINLLLEEYEIEPDICSQQVVDFLGVLEKNHLIMRNTISS
jgi:hypothetical protein